MCGFYQPPIPSLPSILSFAGKTIIITGGARGIGYTASLQLLQHHLSTLILAVRSITRGEAAAASLLHDAEVQRVNPKARIEVIELDLARFESVKGFAGRVEQKLGGQGVDVLLLNAGINLARWEKTVDGFETLIQTNYLSNTLLSLLLLPLLSKSKSQNPRITFVSSMGQNFTSLSPDSPQLSTPILKYFSDPAKYSKIHRYPDSKLFVALFVREFGKQLRGKKVIVNCVCPGTVDTEADDNLPWWLRVPMNLNRRLRARTVEDGAAAILGAALVKGKETQGRYVANDVISPLAPVADTDYGRRFGEKLWRETVEELGRADAKVGEIVREYSLSI